MMRMRDSSGPTVVSKPRENQLRIFQFYRNQLTEFNAMWS
jgi:hypothetical protein